MKQAKLVMLLAVMALTVTSCKKDDDGNGEFSLNLENFAGTYKMNSYTEFDQEQDQSGGTTTITTITSTGRNFQGTLKFNSNGTYLFDAQLTIDQTIVVDNGTPIEDTYETSIELTGDYTINTNNGTLTINYEDEGFTESTVFDISMFTQTSVTLTYEEIESNPAAGYSYEYSNEMVLVRE